MAFTVTTVISRPTTFIADVISSADGDITSSAIAHGLVNTPSKFTLSNVLQSAAGLSQWSILTSNITSTTFAVTKATTAASGNAAIQMRVCIEVPHSIT